MIYTITLNPSIDYIVHVKQFHLGELNKMDDDAKFPGGKGINVSRVLTELESDTTAVGFLGGFSGDFINDWLNKDGVHSDFVSISDDTRINIKLKSDVETEINGRGPVITSSEANDLLSRLDKISEKDTVILSGSKPPSLPEDFYEEMVKKVKKTNAEFVIDTTGKDLKATLPYKPLLVKPNREELSELFNVNLKTIKDVIPYGKKLLDMGAKHVIVSMAGDGALLFTNNGIYQGFNPKGNVKNSVGAGDSMIAGFIGQYTKKQDPIAAFKMGIACGSATAFSDDLAKKETILSLLNQVELKEI
ncbi:1-phosphofructokinase [Oceanobacillus sp. Castelsardo]|uniref:1-phosphofructokinase n=1 Tax=Oceanobacillus sp. Castelsardo TaxID=1851204 RepID=UPI00083978B6|nr:1-phosphofructokinase [Oceanobacillus sp. Castelsardo]